MLSIEWLLFVPVAIAAMIRGYTGFGFAAISILAIGQWYPVHIAVPVVLLLDAVTGLPLLLGSWRQCCVRTLNSLLLAGVAGMPAGLFLLFYLEESTLRLLVALVILLMGLLSYLPSSVAQSVIKSGWICGVMSGWTTSAVSAGGIPVIMHMVNSSLSLRKQRATLIMYFVISSILCVSLILMGTKDLDSVFDLFLGLLPVCISGALAGKVFFHFYETGRVQQIAFSFMMLLASLSLIKAVYVVF
ncbi:sulfite exporter TauE/SafE family protein [Endozoicomonas elysicola]|uniref:Probable membrane transporter protein n=1 Tax=Endozoicomonas elysicola TaxID=305900 RepID=A0A081KB26_9GAMM|nr:sulfite exporter TauE/SafE family protein [Endozoicomonas elysicola]KEI71352.1 hypothetical protein GV64_11910 [Endozoicomonas elysicola]